MGKRPYDRQGAFLPMLEIGNTEQGQTDMAGATDPRTVQMPNNGGPAKNFLNDFVPETGPVMQDWPRNEDGGVDWFSFLAPLLGAGIGAAMGGGASGAAVGAASAYAGKLKGEAEAKKEWRSRAERHLRERRVLRQQKIDNMFRLFDRARASGENDLAADIMSRMTGEDKGKILSRFQEIEKDKRIKDINARGMAAKSMGDMEAWRQALMDFHTEIDGVLTDNDIKIINSMVTRENEERKLGYDTAKMRLEALELSVAKARYDAGLNKYSWQDHPDKRRSMARASIVADAMIVSNEISASKVNSFITRANQLDAEERRAFITDVLAENKTHLTHDVLKQVYEHRMEQIKDEKIAPELKAMFTRNDGTLYNFEDLFGTMKLDGKSDPDLIITDPVEDPDIDPEKLKNAETVLRAYYEGQGVEKTEAEIKAEARRRYRESLEERTQPSQPSNPTTPPPGGQQPVQPDTTQQQAAAPGQQPPGDLPFAPMTAGVPSGGGPAAGPPAPTAPTGTPNEDGSITIQGMGGMGHSDATQAIQQTKEDFAGGLDKMGSAMSGAAEQALKDLESMYDFTTGVFKKGNEMRIRKQARALGQHLNFTDDQINDLYAELMSGEEPRDAVLNVQLGKER